MQDSQVVTATYLTQLPYFREENWTEAVKWPEQSPKGSLSHSCFERYHSDLGQVLTDTTFSVKIDRRPNHVRELVLTQAVKSSPRYHIYLTNCPRLKHNRRPVFFTLSDIVITKYNIRHYVKTSLYLLIFHSNPNFGSVIISILQTQKTKTQKG